MASRKITVTIDEAQVAQIRRLIKTGRATSVSSFVQHAVDAALDDVAGWEATLARALQETGGPLSTQERALADAALGVPKRRRRSASLTVGLTLGADRSVRRFGVVSFWRQSSGSQPLS